MKTRVKKKIGVVIAIAVVVIVFVNARFRRRVTSESTHQPDRTNRTDDGVKKIILNQEKKVNMHQIHKMNQVIPLEKLPLQPQVLLVL